MQITRSRVQHKPHPLAACATLLVCLCVLAAGCGRRQAKQQAATEQGQIRTYQVKGIVVSSDPKKGEVTLDSEAIPGFMEAMIMPYTLGNPNVAHELHSGDHIMATLEVSDSSAVLSQVVITAQAKPDYKPDTVYNVPKPGQSVPDFSLLNQDGRLIRLHQFRGQALLVTFIYTRCPLADYCIRMSRNFATIYKALAAHPEISAKAHLLTVSFDPEHDTPAVLRRYGRDYAGGNLKEAFSHWDFAAPPKDELKKVEEFFSVGVTQGSDGTLTHSLSTVLIDKEGKIQNWYPSNHWDPAEVLKQLEKAASSTSSEAAPSGPKG